MKLIIILFTLFICNQAYCCSVNPDNIKYTLYNKDNAGGLSPFTASNLIVGEPIFLIIHGWRDDSSHRWIISARNNLLTKYTNCNIIIVDYGTYSQDPIYFFTWCTAPAIGDAITTKLRNLDLPTDKITIIGFSIGAQIAGIVGREIKKLSLAPLAAIIGLDAAGVGYDEGKSIFLLFSHEYLKRGDAQKVVGIYSDREGLGMKTIYGDINIFINDGSDQDCPLVLTCPIFNPLQAVNPCIFCAHIHSRETFLKAILMVPIYTARKCGSFNAYTSCSGNTKFVLQALVPTDAENGLYFIKIGTDYQQRE